MKRSLLIKGRIAVGALIATALLGSYKLMEMSGFADNEEVGTAKEYMAPDLYVEFGDLDVDWREGIEYDTDKYVLDVVDKTEASAHLYHNGGTYPVEYRLRLKADDDKLVYAAKLEAFEEIKALIEAENKVEEKLPEEEQEELLEEEQEKLPEEGQNVDLENEITELGIAESHPLYAEYMEYLEYLEELKIEAARVNEVGSVYFYRDVIINSPVEYDDIAFFQNQSYDLTQGLVYDEQEYTLEILNEEEFDISEPYTYAMQYELTNSYGFTYYFMRWINVDGSIESDGNDSIIMPMAVVVPSNNTISTPGTYFKTISGTATTTYISITAKNVTLHLSGSGTIGGLKLSAAVESLTIWVESGSVINFLSGTTSTAGINGGTNAQIFILGEGTLSIYGSAAGNGGSSSSSSTYVSTGGAGGVGAAAGVSTAKSLSIYSLDENITIIGGNGGYGGTGGYAVREGGSTTRYYRSGPGGGGGGYIAFAVGSVGSLGSSGGSGTAAYDPNRGNYNKINGPSGGRGGNGSLGGGGGSGATADPSASYLGTVGTSIYITGRGGSSGSVNQTTGVTTSGGNGAIGSNRYKSDRTTLVATGGAGGIGGSSYGAVTTATTMPVFFHYSGSELANPRGSSGSVYGGTTNAGSMTVIQTGLGVNNFYGFSNNLESIENGPNNVVDVINGEFDDVGVSYSPAPPIDLEFYWTDPLGTKSALIWHDPDYEGRNTGYDIPDGYEIIGYNINAYVDDSTMTSEPISYYYTVNQVQVTPGKLIMPDSDSLTNVYYWSASLVIKSPSGTLLESPTAVIQMEPPVIAVMRENDHDYGSAFMNLSSALAYIKEDDWVGTKDELAEYRIVYLANYNHNVGTTSAVSTDKNALENFSQGNTHLIFETMLISTTNTVHTNRYTLTATEFNLPRDNPSIDTDDNISVTFRDFRMTATTVHTYGTDLTILEENLVIIANLRAVGTGEVGSITTAAGKYIDIQGGTTLASINLENGKYAPEIYIGSVSDSEPEKLFDFEIELSDLQGAARLTLREKTQITVTADIALPWYEDALDSDKNGHVVFEDDSCLYLPGESDTNAVGYLEVNGSNATLRFDNNFAPEANEEGVVDVNEIPAPLRVNGDTLIDTQQLVIAIDDAYLEDETWAHKDIIQFTSVDKVKVNDYYSSRLIFGVDEITCSLEIWAYQTMKIEVTFPSGMVMKFPTYKEAAQYIEYDYTGATGTFTIKLIEDYDRLGIGGYGLESNDNKALRHLVKANSTFIFTADTDPETDELYKFVEFELGAEGESGEEDGYNSIFCLPENSNLYTNTFTFIDFDLSFVEEIYMGHGTLNITDSVSMNGDLKLYGRYSDEDEAVDAPTSYKSELNIPASIELKDNGEDEGIELEAFTHVTLQAGSKLYLSGMNKGTNYATYMDFYATTELYLTSDNIYEMGVLYSRSTDIKIFYMEKDSVIYSYGTGNTGSANTSIFYAYFGKTEYAINKELIHFYNLAGEPVESYATNAASITASTTTRGRFQLAPEVNYLAVIEADAHILKTATYVAVVSPETETVSYYKSLMTALNGDATSTAAGYTAGIKNEEEQGEYLIAFLDDYTLTTNAIVTTSGTSTVPIATSLTDITSLYNFHRDDDDDGYSDISLKFTSKKNDSYLEALNTEVSTFNTEEVDDDSEEEIDDNADYHKLIIPNDYVNAYSAYATITLPAYYATEVTFDEILFSVVTEGRVALIRSAGGGVTMGKDIRLDNCEMDISGYSHYNNNYYINTAMGKNPHLTIYGGTYRNVYGAREASSTLTSVTAPAYQPEIHLYGGTFDYVYGGNSYTGTSGYRAATEINLYEADNPDDTPYINYFIKVANIGGTVGVLNVHGSMVLPSVLDFGQMHIADDATVVMNGVLDRIYTSYTATTGALYLGENTQLQLFNIATTVYAAYNNTGTIYTTGPGASIVFPKQDNGQVPLYFEIANDCVNIDEGGVLTLLPHPDSEFVAGDYLIRFTTNALSRDIYLYNNGFYPYGLIGSTSDGYLRLSAMPITLNRNDGEAEYFTDIEAAFIDIGRDETEIQQETDYTITVREDGYTFSNLDQIAMAAASEDIKSITLTSTFKLGELDTILENEHLGLEVTRYVNVGSGWTQVNNFAINTTTYIDNIIINPTTAFNFNACGNPLYIGTNKAPYLGDYSKGTVQMMSESVFPTVYGGTGYNTTTPISKNTHLEVGSGTYANIYGGSIGQVSGNVTTIVGNPENAAGDATYPTVIGYIVGGGVGNSANIYGDVDFTIHNVQLRNPTTYLIAGNYTAGTNFISGDVNTTIYGTHGSGCTIYLLGTHNGRILGGLTIRVAESPNKPTGDAVYIYPSFITSSGWNHNNIYGRISGDVDLFINNGQGATLIQESRYNPTIASYKKVAGDFNIYIGAGGLNDGSGGGSDYERTMPTIYNFDNLHVGYRIDDEETGELIEAGATQLTITNQINRSSTTIWDGNVHMGQNSVLNFTSTATSSIGNLYVDDTLPQINIAKLTPTGVTYPLQINGANLTDHTELSKRLVLGIHVADIAEGYEYADYPKVDDKLLYYPTRGNAVEEHYVSGVENYDTVLYTDTRYIVLGASLLPQVTTVEVAHKDADGNVTTPAIGANTITKTIEFLIHNNDENGDYNGYDIQSAYIDTTSVPNTTWELNGTIPSTRYATVSIEKNEDEESWTAFTTFDVESYSIRSRVYYLHVRDERGSVKTVLLDVHSPTYNTTPLVEQVDGGDYNITLDVYEPIYTQAAGTDGIDHPYIASGIAQVAWTFGKTTGSFGVDEILENKIVVESDRVKGVEYNHNNNISYHWTLEVPKETFEDVVDMDDAVIYLYIKDNYGNTREISIPMSQYTIDVSIPTRIGILAYSDVDNYLLAPECYVINNGNNTVKAEIIGNNIADNNELNIVTGTSESHGENDICLILSSKGKADEYHAFDATPVGYLTQAPLTLGIMTAKSGNLNSVYYTFEAVYKASNLDLTSSWSLFSMQYRFTMIEE